MNTLKTFVLLTIGVLAGALIFTAFPAERTGPGELGAQSLTGAVTMTSTTVQTTPTVVVSATANLQKITLRNAGPAQVFCGFGAVSSTLYTGLVFDVPNTTSTLQERTIADPFLLNKRMTCIGNGASSTLTILQWTN